jgi:tRNA 2-thiouridine synthesizing protein A
MQESTIPADRELDVRGAQCPIPLIRARQEINQLQVGQTLKVIATDPWFCERLQGVGSDSKKHRTRETRRNH